MLHDATDYFHWLDQNGIKWAEHINCLRKRGWISYHVEVPQALAQTYETTWVEQRDGVKRPTPKAPPNTPAPFPKPACRTFQTTYFPNVLVTFSRKRARLWIIDLDQRDRSDFIYNQDIDAFVAWCRANGCKLMTRGFCQYDLECRDKAAFELFKATWYRVEVEAAA
ncbi:hypothetical protein [Methylorubrum extorquens]|uniref:hypothetical protein n=1 Tax=Methylorubrum extorquens TaxID=408 RepID=UPI00059C6654|nr:hypothetical protein [Methylorubrum extorquens]